MKPSNESWIWIPPSHIQRQKKLLQRAMVNHNKVITAFTWSRTKQGYNYWENIYRNGHTGDSLIYLFFMIKQIDDLLGHNKGETHAKEEKDQR